MSELNERTIKEIQYATRELYIKILLSEYCDHCITNTNGECGLYDMSIRDAIVIEKQVDCKSDKRLLYIGNCRARVCYRNTQVEFEEWMEDNYGRLHT